MAERDRNAVIHRKPDSRAAGSKLHIDDPRKRLCVVHVASRQIQNDLLGGNSGRKRREVHVQMSDRTAKCVDIIEPKYLRRRDCRGKISNHSSIYSAKKDRTLHNVKHQPKCAICPARDSAASHYRSVCASARIVAESRYCFRWNKRYHTTVNPQFYRIN